MPKLTPVDEVHDLWIIAAPQDAQLASYLAGALSGLGLNPRLEAPKALTKSQHAAVLLSASAARDHAWLESVNRLQNANLIPVKVGDVDPQDVPGTLAVLNWIMWLPDRPDDTVYRLFTAARSDVQRHRIGRSVESLAHAWERGGHQDDDLILTVPRAREAISLASGRGPKVEAFASLSLRKARRLRRRLWVRQTRRLVTVVVTVAVVAVAVISLRAEGRAFKISVGASSLAGTSRPDLTAMKEASTLLYHLGQSDAHLADFRALASTLSLPWTKEVIGVQEDSALNDVAFLEDTSRLVSVDGRGSVIWWNTMTGNAVARVGYGIGPLYAVTATPDGRRIAAASGSAIVVVDGQGKVVRKAAVAGADSLALSGNGDELVARLPDDSLRIVDIASGQVTVPALAGKVLALRTLKDGMVEAALSSGKELSLFDPVSERAIWTESWSPPTYPIAAIGPDGEIAVEQADARIWWAPPDQQLRSTGIRLSDALQGLAMTSERAIVASALIGGTELIDPVDDLDLGRICPALGRLYSIAPGVDPNELACVGFGLADIEDVTLRVPRAPSAPTVSSTSPAPPATVTSSVGNIRSVSIDSGTLVSITDRYGNVTTLDPAATGMSARLPRSTILAPGDLEFRGTPVSVAIQSGGDTLAVGSSDGTLTEMDVRSASDLSEVGRWQLADDTAVQSIRWDSSGHIIADTEQLEWAKSSCSGCYLNLTKMYLAVSQRIWRCYPGSAATIYEPGVQKLLGIRRCSALPTPSAP